MNRLHVVVRSIAPSGGFGGLERSAADHVSSMRSAGVDVLVHAPGISSDEGVRVPWPTLSKPQSLVQGLSYAVWIRAVGRSLGASVQSGDVVHFHGSAAAASAYLPEFVPSVMNPHGLEEFDPIGFSTVAVRPILRLLSRRGAAASTRVISTDRSITPGLVRKLKISPEKIELIPNAIDAHALRDLAAGYENSLKSNDRRQGVSINIVTVGRVEHNKGYDLLAESLVRCRDADWTWTHFGSGSQQGAVRAIIDSAGLLDRVQFCAGASDEHVQHALSEADLFVQPSRSEGSSLTTLEAMSHGVFILATSVGGIPDKIDSGTHGLLTTPNLHQLSIDLKNALSLARTSPAMRMGSQARAKVEAEFSARASTAAYLRLYANLSAR